MLAELREGKEERMRLRVATNGTRFVVVSEPGARKDREGRQRQDARSGALLWEVSVVPIGDEVMKESMTLVVDAEPTGVSAGSFVEVVDLVAASWEIEGRSGTSFRAARVVPVAVSHSSKSAA